MRRLFKLRLSRRLFADLRIVIREVPRDGDGPDDPRVKLAARSVGELYVVMGAALGAWIVYLATVLPQRNTNLHYDLTWIGFDLLLLSAVAATAWHAFRLSPRVTLAANATATLLVVDAWMDVTSSVGTGALATAIAFAVLLELPVALISLRIARNVTQSLAAHARAALDTTSTPAAAERG